LAGPKKKVRVVEFQQFIFKGVMTFSSVAEDKTESMQEPFPEI